MSDKKVDYIKYYKTSIEKNQNDPERLLHCLKKLENLRINVQHLQETGIGRTVNALRGLSGEAGDLALTLVHRWKSLVSEKESMSNKSDAKEEEQQPEKAIETERKSHHSKSSKENGEKNSESSSSSKKSKHHSSSSSHHSHHNQHHHSSSSSEQRDNSSKKSSDSKSSESKHHKSSSGTSSSSTSHHKSSSSSSSKKRSHEEEDAKENELKAKKLKIDSEKSSGDERKKSSGSSSKNNDHKESSSSKSKSSSEKRHSSGSSKRKRSKDEDAGAETKEFDGTGDIGFAEALMMFDHPSSSSKSTKKQLADKLVTVKSSSSKSSKEKEKDQQKSKPSTSSSSTSTPRASTSQAAAPSASTADSSKKSLQTLTQPPKLLTQKPKLDLLPDIVSELPNDVSIPEYRPAILNSAVKDYINSNYGTSSYSCRPMRQLNDAELLVESFSSKANRTKVFSGNSKTRAQIPKLFEMCIRVLQENIDYLEITGGVPFDLLRPVLERAKPEQLQVIEYYNPYLLEESDVLWEPHCKRKWKNKQPDEMETWREMYERCVREEEEKLSRLTKNIRHHQEITSNGVQKTKMAYVDSFVKPPRGVARKQEQFGTNRKLVASPAARVEALKNLAPNLARPGDVRLRVAAGLRDDAQQVVGRGNMQRANLAKKAPMMAKILSKFKR